MISVLVPVYNVEKYLSRCLDSILKQTYTDFEIVLVDPRIKAVFFAMRMRLNMNASGLFTRKTLDWRRCVMFLWLLRRESISPL